MFRAQQTDGKYAIGDALYVSMDVAEKVDVGGLLPLGVLDQHVVERPLPGVLCAEYSAGKRSVSALPRCCGELWRTSASQADICMDVSRSNPRSRGIGC